MDKITTSTLLSPAEIQAIGPKPGDYNQWMIALRERFTANCKLGPLFRTTIRGLFQKYIESFPDEWKQYHNCTACHRFLSRFGGLVVITADGEQIPAIWHLDDVPEHYRGAVTRFYNMVKHAKIKGVFIPETVTLGTPVTGEWTHFGVDCDPSLVHVSKIETANQVQSSKTEDYILLIKSLTEIKPETVATALRILSSDKMARPETVYNPIKWFSDLQTKVLAEKKLRPQLVWHAVATSFKGWAHIKNGVAGTLFEDIEAGHSFETIRRKFAAKTGGLVYQRAQVAPTAGAIKVAEQTIEKLGLARSLERRYAKLSEIDAFWRPTALVEPEPAAGVFGHLRPKGSIPTTTSVELPTSTMTWQKFASKHLPDAKQIEFYVRPNVKGSYCGVLTQLHDDAKPIVQWDKEDRRNPFSWYMYDGGSYASNWSLTAGWVTVTAISFLPPMWYGGVSDHHGVGLILSLDGAVNIGGVSSNGLFGSIIRSDLHGVRSVIEAYSKTAIMHGLDAGDANGYMTGSGNWDIMLRVNGDLMFKIDRLD